MSTPGLPRLSLQAQYVAHLLWSIAPELLARPGSRAARVAIRRAADNTTPVLAPSRRELTAALAELGRAGRLPITPLRASQLTYSLTDWVAR